MRSRHAVLLVLSIVAVIATVAHAPIPQDPAYHAFADARPFAGIPNFADVISNLPFLIAGIYGLTRKPGTNRAAYITLCAGVLLVSLGSAYYHLSPSNPTLLWDRLPMTIAFMALFSLLLEERVVDAKTLAPLLAAGVASAVYWHWTDDLRPYLLVQFLPMILMPVILALYERKYLKTSYLVIALLLYTAAKFFEYYDARILSATGLASGHTLKHLAAGAASAYIIVSVPEKEDACCSA